jgi:hypothetical protein
VISIATRVLHLVARVAIRSVRPARARAFVAAAARFAPRLDEETARDALASLDGRGTCLSRSLAVAARLDGGQIAIGVRYGTGAPLRAHAWVVSHGLPLREIDPDGDIIALLDPASASGGWGGRLTAGGRFA